MKITELRSLIREAVKAQLKEAKMSKEKIEGLIWSLENEIRPWHPSDNSKKKAMLDKLKKKLSKFESGIKESKQLKEYSGDSGLEELVDMLGYSDVMEFFEDNSGAVDAVYKWVESIPSFKQKMKQSGMYESSLKEADMTRQYDGFIVQDRKTLKNYKFRYIKGVNNVKVEDAAIAKVMAATKGPRAQFWVNGSIKKGDFDKDTSLTINA